MPVCAYTPTEILATQHFETLKQWAEPIGVKVALLTGSTRTAARREIHERLESGEIDIIAGTHALIEDTVRFKCLGLAVIDEQIGLVLLRGRGCGERIQYGLMCL